MALQLFVGPLSFFQFVILYTVGRTPLTGYQPVASPLSTHRTAQAQNKNTQTSMPRVGFESTTPAFKWAKTVHALDCAASVAGPLSLLLIKKVTGSSKRQTASNSQFLTYPTPSRPAISAISSVVKWITCLLAGCSRPTWPQF
jgi:hypothetical protein